MVRGRAVQLSELEGAVLTDVVAAWHLFGGERSEEPIAIWLTVDGIGQIEVHTPGDGSLGLALDTQPPAAFDMDQYGSVILDHEAATIPLSAFCGCRIEEVAVIEEAELDYACGIVFGFAPGSVGLANVADEIWCKPWTDAGWPGFRVRDRDDS